MPIRTSLVIPVLDDARALDRCLTAVRCGAVQPDEIVVVDNGCVDDSVAVAHRFGARVVPEPIRGIASAASRGYDEARGELILRIDADTIVAPDWVARIVSVMEDGTVDAVTGPGDFRGFGPVRTLLADLLYFRPYFRGIGDTIGRVPLFGSNMAMRATAWRAASGAVHRHDPEVHDDLDLALAMVDAHIVFDSSLTVSISARPFGNPVRLARRLYRGVHTALLWNVSGAALVRHWFRAESMQPAVRHRT